MIGSFTEEGGYEAARALLADAELTAVFAANDLSALGVMHAIAETGRRVPDDVSVVGFDDLRLAAPHDAAADDRAAAGVRDRRAGDAAAARPRGRA